jgi:hypothetical protein
MLVTICDRDIHVVNGISNIMTRDCNVPQLKEAAIDQQRVSRGQKGD